MRDFAIYTVCTGHYKYGLFTLVNSLIHFGYKGPIVVATDKHIDELTNAKQVEQEIIDSEHIFGCLKGHIILKKPAKKFLYLDPDVIQLNPNFINIVIDLIEKTGKLILSVEGLVGKNDVRRITWNTTAGINGEPQNDAYYSAGLVGGSFELHKNIIESWDAHINRFIEPGKYFRCCPEFPLADQDILNLVVQNLNPQDILSISIPDWIGTATGINPFHEFGFYESPLFVHATGKAKTWTLTQVPMRYPNPYDKAFYKFIQMTQYGIDAKYSFSRIEKLWLTESKILPVFNNLRKILKLF